MFEAEPRLDDERWEQHLEAESRRIDEEAAARRRARDEAWRRAADGREPATASGGQAGR